MFYFFNTIETIVLGIVTKIPDHVSCNGYLKEIRRWNLAAMKFYTNLLVFNRVSQKDGY